MIEYQNQKPSYFPTDKIFGPNRTEYRLIDAVWNPPTKESSEYWECKYESISPWNVIVLRY